VTGTLRVLVLTGHSFDCAGAGRRHNPPPGPARWIWNGLVVGRAMVQLSSVSTVVTLRCAPICLSSLREALPTFSFLQQAARRHFRVERWPTSVLKLHA